jgi:hypothetical protein
MSYYVVKVYGLVCDNCEASEEYVPDRDAPDKLAATRRALAAGPTKWTYKDGKDLCSKCSDQQSGRSV